MHIYMSICMHTYWRTQGAQNQASREGEWRICRSRYCIYIYKDTIDGMYILLYVYLYTYILADTRKLDIKRYAKASFSI